MLLIYHTIVDISSFPLILVSIRCFECRSIRDLGLTDMYSIRKMNHKHAVKQREGKEGELEADVDFKLCLVVLYLNRS